MKKITFRSIIAMLKEISENATSFDDFLNKYHALEDMLWNEKSKYIFCWDDHTYNENGKINGYTDCFYDDTLYLMNSETDTDHDVSRYFRKVIDKYGE